MVLFDDDGISEKTSTSENITLPTAKNLRFILVLARPDTYPLHFGSVNYLDNEHGSFEKEKFLAAMEEFKVARRTLGMHDDIIVYLSELDVQKQVKIDDYVSINWNPEEGALKLAKKIKSHTNTFLNDSMKYVASITMSKNNKCERGTVNPFSTGATLQVGQLNKFAKVYNCCNATKPYLDKSHKFSKLSAKCLLYNHVALQVLNFSQGNQDFNLSRLRHVATLNSDNLLTMRKKWCSKFTHTEFNEEQSEAVRLNNIFWDTYIATRKAIREELLASLCPELLDDIIDKDFRQLLRKYVQSQYSDIGTETNVSNITYRRAIEIVSSAIAEAIATRWSLDCGVHFDKQTCPWFHWTVFCSFKQFLSELRPTTNKLTTKLQATAAIESSTKRPYQYCMVAGYGRKVVHQFSLKLAKQAMALETNYFSHLSKLVLFMLKKTQGSIFDYNHIFECQVQLSDFYRQYINHPLQERLQMNGPLYTVPMTFSRIVSAK